MQQHLVSSDICYLHIADARPFEAGSAATAVVDRAAAPRPGVSFI